MEQLAREGVALAFEDVGRGAPPILLIHDLGCDHTSLRPQLEHYRGRHRVTAVDLRGHGQSDGLSRPYTVADFADDLGWLCYELGLYRPVAVGQGVGAMIAVEFAVRWPDLPAAVVALAAPFGLVPEAHARVVEVIAKSPHLAATWETVMAWDGTAALAHCPVPVLHVTSGTSQFDVASLPDLC